MWGVAAGYSETRGNLSLPEEPRQTGCVCWELGGGTKGGRGSQADVKRKQIVLRLLFSSLLLLFSPFSPGCQFRCSSGEGDGWGLSLCLQRRLSGDSAGAPRSRLHLQMRQNPAGPCHLGNRPSAPPTPHHHHHLPSHPPYRRHRQSSLRSSTCISLLSHLATQTHTRAPVSHHPSGRTRSNVFLNLSLAPSRKGQIYIHTHIQKPHTAS